MTRATIAAVIPVHNKGPHIARAIQSVLDQADAVDEILVVDDVSTDGSLDIIRSFDDPRLRVFERKQPGPGGYAARNLAIREARSQWIAFLDADDSWDGDYLTEIRRLIEAAGEESGCVFTARRVHEIDGRVHVVGCSGKLDLQGFIENWLRIRIYCPIWTSSTVIRRDVLLEAGLFPEARCKRGGDKDTWLRVMALTTALASPAPKASYFRDTVNSVTQNTSMNVRPCACSTLDDLIAASSGKLRDQLVELSNNEMYWYARQVSRVGPVSPAVYKGFNVRRNPGRYALMMAAIYAPAWMKSLATRARHVARRRAA